MKPLSDRLLSARRPAKCIEGGKIERLPRDTRPGKSRKYFAHLKQLMREAASKGIRQLAVVLYGRVSSPGQRVGPQLAEVRRTILRLATRYGIKVEILDEPFTEEVSAWRLWKSERPELVKAAKLAREKGAVLVALNTSRFVRSNYYHRCRTLPTVDDFERLMNLVGNVQLATILPPEQHEDRGADTILGQKARKARPGRPRKRTKEQRKRLARLLYSRGWIIRRIAAKRMVGASRSTVHRWINE